MDQVEPILSPENEAQIIARATTIIFDDEYAKGKDIPEFPVSMSYSPLPPIQVGS
jgi:hypothetical protein